MHNLTATTSLGGTTPRIDQIGAITIAERDHIAMASTAARRGGEKATATALKSLLKAAAPAAGYAAIGGDYIAFWTGPDQWMISASGPAHEMLADTLVAAVKGQASVTEQSGAWAQFDISGAHRVDMMERLTALPVRQMQAGEANRTRIEQLGCFVLCHADHFSVLGPRASAQSLHHALTAAARSVA